MAFYLLQFLDLRKQSALSFLNFGCDIGIILIFGLHLLYVVNRKWENRLNLRPWTIIKKTHGTLFSLIFEVWEKKVPLIFFSDLTQILRYSHFLNFWTAPFLNGRQKMRKWPNLSPWAKIDKTKGTLFSSTFKVWANKVPLVSFDYLLRGSVMAIF